MSSKLKVWQEVPTIECKWTRCSFYVGSIIVINPISQVWEWYMKETGSKQFIYKLPEGTNWWTTCSARQKTEHRHKWKCLTKLHAHAWHSLRFPVWLCTEILRKKYTRNWMFNLYCIIVILSPLLQTVPRMILNCIYTWQLYISHQLCCLYS